MEMAYKAQAIGAITGGVQSRPADTVASRSPSLRDHMARYGDTLSEVSSLVERAEILADKMLGPEPKQQQPVPPNAPPPAGACAALAAADEHMTRLLHQLARQVSRLEGATE